MADFARLIEVLDGELSRIVPPGSAAVYLDYPVHQNIGDLLIYLGTEEWIRTKGIRIVGRWNWRNFPFPRLEPSTIILCHGGGNLGDLYQAHQHFRERILAGYPDNRIAILPQTIFFGTDDALKAAARAFSGHGRCHILARDRTSLEIARDRLGCSASLVPDMACFLYPLSRHLGLSEAPGAGRRVCLLRNDVEAVDEATSPDGEAWKGDWAELLGRRLLTLAALQRANVKASGLFGAQSFAAIWYRAAKSAVRLAALELLRAEAITTTRLHGYIMARLLDREAVLLDNSYGKNSRYLHQWHTQQVMSTQSS
jgi:pyruvyl transferase EpsO